VTDILVGYEVSDDPRRAGRAITVPLKHTAVLGQTQESGKTTTQEAMITRSGLRAIAFLTKRGEGSFRLSRPIAPFFKDTASGPYWKYVHSIMEGMLDMRLGFQERGWLMKLCDEYEGFYRKREEYVIKATKKRKAETTTRMVQHKYAWPKADSLRQLLKNVQVALNPKSGIPVSPTS
jgi:hypothetical protein